MEKSDRLKLVEEWVRNNRDIILNAKLNNLKFLKELTLHIGVKDTRSLGKVLEVKYKKDILGKLLDIIKCTPNSQMNKSV